MHEHSFVTDCGTEGYLITATVAVAQPQFIGVFYPPKSLKNGYRSSNKSPQGLEKKTENLYYRSFLSSAIPSLYGDFKRDRSSTSDVWNKQIVLKLVDINDNEKYFLNHRDFSNTDVLLVSYLTEPQTPLSIRYA